MSRHNDRSIRIRILNSFGNPVTSLFNAKRFVSRGLAHWVGGTIEFIRDAGDCREQAAQMGYDRAADSGLASARSVRNLPIAGPSIRVFTDPSKSPRRARVGQNGPVRVVVCAGAMIDRAQDGLAAS